jgi:hypothetical protein
MVKKIIFDSNFLMIPFELGIDVFEEVEKILSVKVEPVILPPVIEELERLASRGKPKVRRLASSALELAKQCVRLQYSKLPSETVDEYLVRVAKEKSMAVATADLELKRKLRAEGIPTIYVREKSRLDLEGWWE